MTTKLIPVIEIRYNNQGVTAPDNYPYWENFEIWDNYYQECYKKAGFTDNLTPYLKGSSFYRLSDISTNNLTKLTIDHTREMRDGKYKRLQDTCAFSGGYILRVNGQDKYFPQCCGELSDINYWENIASGKSSYHEEHPTPQLKFDNNKIVFDFSTDEFDEPFQPTPAEMILTINKSELKTAVEEVKSELLVFQQRLELINENENLNIEDIGGLLIWDNENYE